MLYAVFGMIISVAAGIVLSIISMIFKIKAAKKIIINIVSIGIFILTIPMWWYFLRWLL